MIFLANELAKNYPTGFQIIGRAALAMHGFNVVPEKITVLVCQELFLQLAKSAYGPGKKVVKTFSPCGKIHSYHILSDGGDGVEISFQSDVEVLINGVWTPGPTIQRDENPYLNIVDGVINVAPVQHIAAILGMFNRTNDRALLALIAQGAENKDSAPAPKVVINFGIDFDGTITAASNLFAAFVYDARKAGHKVFIVTMRYPSEECKDLSAWRSLVDDIVFTERQAKEPVMAARNTPVHIWFEDNPKAVTMSAMQIWGACTPEGVTHSPTHDKETDARDFANLTTK